MENIGATPPPAVGKNVSVWLPPKIRTVFERHVGPEYGAEGRYGKAAIIAALQRDGAFDAKQSANAGEVLASVPPAAVPLLVELAELIAARGADSVRAMLGELKSQTLETEPARR